MRNVLLNLMVVLSVFSVQGCWADGTESEISKDAVSMESGPTEATVLPDKNTDAKVNLEPSHERKASDQNGKSPIDYERFRELFVGTYQPASKGYWGQGELTITENTVTWKGCDKVPYEITRSSKDAFYIKIENGFYCKYKEERVSYMKIFINKWGGYGLSLYESEPRFLDDWSFIEGEIGREKND